MRGHIPPYRRFIDPSNPLRYTDKAKKAPSPSHSSKTPGPVRRYAMISRQRLAVVLSQCCEPPEMIKTRFVQEIQRSIPWKEVILAVKSSFAVDGQNNSSWVPGSDHGIVSEAVKFEKGIVPGIITINGLCLVLASKPSGPSTSGSQASIQSA